MLNSGSLRAGTVEFELGVQMLAPNAAHLISRYELIRPKDPQYGINTRLMRKVDGRWVIALNHVSSSDTPPVPTEPGKR